MTELKPLSLNRAFITFILKLFTRGTSAFLIIFGRRETGKTDFSLLIAEILFKEEIIKNFATNIKIYSSHVPFEHITNLEDLKFWCKNTKGRKMFIFDEYGKAMRRRSPMSSLNVKLIDHLQILRKYKLSTVAITVDEKYVDNASLGSDILDGVFLKPNYKNPKIALYEDKLEYYTRTLYDIPATTIKFDTWDVAPFQEHSPKKKPHFKEEHKQLLWDWSHGKTSKEIGLDRKQIHRISTKFIKEVLEREVTRDNQ